MEDELRARNSDLRIEGERDEVSEILREEGEEEEEENDDEDINWEEEEMEELVPVRTGDGRRRRGRAVRRTNGELSLALAVHTVGLCYYIYVLVWEATVIKNHKGPASVWYGSTPYGGRWKFLTVINLKSQFLFFFLAFFSDIMPRSPAKVWFQKLADFFFATIAFPLTMVVFFYFWTLFLVDRDLIHPAYLDQYVPTMLNHAQHSFIMAALVIEAMLVFHPYPSNLPAFAAVFAFCSSYTVWVLFIFTKTGRWVYPFMKFFTPYTFLLFAVLCTAVAFLFFHLGKVICKLNPYWRERYQILSATAHNKVQ